MREDSNNYKSPPLSHYQQPQEIKSQEILDLGARLWNNLSTYESYFFYEAHAPQITKNAGAFGNPSLEFGQSSMSPMENFSMYQPAEHETLFGHSYFNNPNGEMNERTSRDYQWNQLSSSNLLGTTPTVSSFGSTREKLDSNFRNSEVSMSPPLIDHYSSLDDSRAPIPPAYEPIFRQLKQKEKKGFQEAKEFALSHVDTLPDKLKWRLYLELADVAKRESMVKDAREYYREATLLHPHASQTWLEYAKLEEECGQLSRCQKILNFGLLYCPFNEGLMVKSIKLEEKMGNLKNARAVLARLKYVSIDKGWRVMLEGGLLEARVGNFQIARKVFKYLMKNAPGYGNIFQEACLLEEKCGDYTKAIEIAERGLEENPRYGPLYLTILRLHEKVANGDLSQTREIVERAIKFIPKELKWKIYYEAAQIEDRAGNLELSRQAYVKSVAHCPTNLLWKVWLAGARTELFSKLPGSQEIARRLISRSLTDVPQKKKSQVWLEWAHLEEYVGDLQEARTLLKQARKEASHEWKVYLETILLEIRANNIERAIFASKKALEQHTGTGRLWALLIHLKQIEGIEEQLKVFKEALQEVPKSGEVWCEGARIYLAQNNWVEARRYLEFAIHFTPQFGDSFIEYLRLELLENGDKADIGKLEQLCLNAEPNYGTLWMYCKKSPIYSTRQVLMSAQEILRTSKNHPVLGLGKHYDASQLSDDERWRLIFGCDELKP